MSSHEVVASSESRTSRSARNASTAFLAQALLVFLGFATRTVFLHQIGVELLGVHALLTSLLAIAALADLGMGSAFMYALYQPLRDGDSARVSAIILFAGRLYRWTALGTAVLGLSAVPFLDQLVTLDEPVEHLTLYFLVMLTGSVFTFLMYSRTLLLQADQRSYWLKLVSIVFNVVRSILQIAALLAWQSFLAYLIVQTLCVLANNTFVYWRAGRMYRGLRSPTETLDAASRRTIGQSVRAMLVYRISGLALYNSDPILISIIIGTAALGYYSNYLLIVGSIVMLLEVAFSALVPTVGNLAASGDKGAMRHVLEELHVLAITVYGTASVVLLVSLNDLVQVWLGESYVLSEIATLALVVNFYLVGVTLPIATFRNATGMFRETKYVLLVTAVLNLVLSWILGHTFGLEGILFATALSRLLTHVWIEPLVLFRRYVPGAGRQFVQIHAASLSLLTATYFLISLSLRALDAGLLLSALVSASLAILLVPLSIWLALGRSSAFRRLTKRLTMLRRARR